MFLLLTVFFPHIIYGSFDSGAVHFLLIYRDFFKKSNQLLTLVCSGGVVVGIGGSGKRVKAVLQICGVAVGLGLQIRYIRFKCYFLL